MKKTMLALMATVGLAFGAKADGEVLNSTGFEGLSTFDVKALEYEGDAKEGLYWAVTNTAADLSQTDVANYGASATPAYVPDAFTNAANSTYLKVDTGADVLYRSVAKATSVDGETGMPLLNAGTLIGAGLYFDANVQFTASDGEQPSYDSADKLVVWLKADVENNTTNLMVTAAASADEYGVPQGITDFTVSNVAVDVDTWYRLTVKAAVDVSGHTYFNIYVDNDQVAATDRTDFYSMVNSNTTEGQKITAVGFQGTGAIDNLVWTTENPFPPEGAYTVAFTGDEGFVNNAYDVTVAGTTYTENLDDFSKTGVGVSVTNLTVACTSYASGTLTPSTTAGNVALSAVAKTSGQVVIEEESYTLYTYTFTVTVPAPAANATYSVALAFEEDGGDETEITPGGTGSIADETGNTYTKEAVEAMVTVVAPNGGSLSEEAKAAFNGYFTKNATYNSDAKKWEVTVTLDADALEADVEEAVAEALEAVVAGGATTKTVGIPAGFYYKIEFGTTVGLTGTPRMGISSGPVTMPTLSDDAGFFKVSVDTTSFGE